MNNDCLRDFESNWNRIRNRFYGRHKIALSRNLELRYEYTRLAKKGFLHQLIN